MTNFGVVLIALAALAAPFVALAWLLRVYPRAALVYLALVPALVSMILLAVPADARLPVTLAVLVPLDVLLGLVVVGDLLTLPRHKSLSAERDAVRIASLRKPHPVPLTLLNHGPRALALWICDGVPHELSPQPAEFFIRLAGRSRSTLHYVLRPNRRGAFALEQVHLRIRSRLGLWQRQLDYPLGTLIHVYPDMKQLGQYALLARTNRLSLLGVRRTRRIGQDHDFERLRDYTIDDNYKQIDWRATARRRKLTVKDFQATQSQRIIFLVDCGRMMTNQAAGLSLLDHGLNAMLMLSYVALRQGDSVGMVSFSDEIHSFVPPRGGMQQMNRLLHASFDRFPQLVESRYDLAFRYLASHCRKRSLVVLVTNVIDEVNASQIQRYLSNLVGRHLPLGVLLRDRRLFDAVDVEHPTDDQLWPAAAAADILAWRHQVLSDLQSKGILSLDVFPEEMTAPLVNRYLEIKARHLL
ncbi:MAG: hypothetical protein A2V70_20350 [Planctomycetes bacterium RBG_13_63_9]|nr:MAG: hypothetical protein A2V70_20350 [Planctomycetes bacterium RBG_13_63_9]